jgi:hypothetical protein
MKVIKIIFFVLSFSPFVIRAVTECELGREYIQKLTSMKRYHAMSKDINGSENEDWFDSSIGFRSQRVQGEKVGYVIKFSAHSKTGRKFRFPNPCNDSGEDEEIADPMEYSQPRCDLRVFLTEGTICKTVNGKIIFCREERIRHNTIKIDGITGKRSKKIGKYFTKEERVEFLSQNEYIYANGEKGNESSYWNRFLLLDNDQSQFDFNPCNDSNVRKRKGQRVLESTSNYPRN